MTQAFWLAALKTDRIITGNITGSYNGYRRIACSISNKLRDWLTVESCPLAKLADSGLQQLHYTDDENASNESTTLIHNWNEETQSNECMPITIHSQKTLYHDAWITMQKIYKNGTKVFHRRCQLQHGMRQVNRRLCLFNIGRVLALCPP